VKGARLLGGPPNCFKQRCAPIGSEGARVSIVSTPGLVDEGCGSPSTYKTKEVFALYACTLDDPTLVQPCHVLTGEQLPWLEMTAS
jgi:hypothetical protein